MDLDQMLNGNLTRQRHQEMIQEAQHQRLVKSLQQSAQRSLTVKVEPERKTVVTQLKRALVTTIHALVR